MRLHGQQQQQQVARVETPFWDRDSCGLCGPCYHDAAQPPSLTTCMERTHSSSPACLLLLLLMDVVAVRS